MDTLDLLVLQQLLLPSVEVSKVRLVHKLLDLLFANDQDTPSLTSIWLSVLKHACRQ